MNSTLDNAFLYVDPSLKSNPKIAAKIPHSAKLELVRPSDGFSFLAGPNYEVIKTYNRSTPFAVAVATLANEIALRVPN